MDREVNHFAGREDIDTSTMQPLAAPAVRLMPPLDAPMRSPFYVAQLPTTAIVNPDAVRNFTTPGIPSYRILPPQPLTLAGSTTNATPLVTILPVVLPQPPAPAISQALATIPTGYTFTFLQVKLPTNTNPNAVISSYKVYRNTATSRGGATVAQVISHGLTNNGSPIVVTDPQPNGVTLFYWVSAVNVSGVESTLTPAQSGTVTSNAGFNSNSQLAGTSHNNPVNSSNTPGATSTLSNDGTVTSVVVASASDSFGFGAVTDNSGSFDGGSFTTFYVFHDDPTYAGGAVIYQFSTTPPAQTQADGRINDGKITSANGVAKTGGGYTGGTTPGGAGGRGFNQ